MSTDKMHRCARVLECIGDTGCMWSTAAFALGAMVAMVFARIPITGCQRSVTLNGALLQRIYLMDKIIAFSPHTNVWSEILGIGKSLAKHKLLLNLFQCALSIISVDYKVIYMIEFVQQYSSGENSIRTFVCETFLRTDEFMAALTCLSIFND